MTKQPKEITEFLRHFKTKGFIKHLVEKETELRYSLNNPFGNRRRLFWELDIVRMLIANSFIKNRPAQIQVHNVEEKSYSRYNGFSNKYTIMSRFDIKIYKELLESYKVKIGQDEGYPLKTYLKDLREAV